MIEVLFLFFLMNFSWFLFFFTNDLSNLGFSKFFMKFIFSFDCSFLALKFINFLHHKTFIIIPANEISQPIYEERSTLVGGSTNQIDPHPQNNHSNILNGLRLDNLPRHDNNGKLKTIFD